MKSMERILELTIGPAPNVARLNRGYRQLWEVIRTTDEWVSLNEGEINGDTTEARFSTLRNSAQGARLSIQIVSEDGRLFFRRRPPKPALVIGAVPRKHQIKEHAPEASQPPGAIDESTPDVIATKRKKSKVRGTPVRESAPTPVRAIVVKPQYLDNVSLRREIAASLDYLYSLGDEEEWLALNCGLDPEAWQQYQGELMVCAFEHCPGYRLDWGMDGHLLYFRLVRRQEVTNAS